MFSVQFRGLDKIITKNRLAIQMLERGDLAEELVKRIVRSAKRFGPRHKGDLVKSISYQRIGPNKFKIVATATNEKGEPYPVFLEFGTRFIKIGTPSSPRVYRTSSGKTAHLPYIRSAIWRSTQQKDIDAVVKKLLDIYKR